MLLFPENLLLFDGIVSSPRGKNRFPLVIVLVGKIESDFPPPKKDPGLLSSLLLF